MDDDLDGVARTGLSYKGVSPLPVVLTLSGRVAWSGCGWSSFLLLLARLVTTLLLTLSLTLLPLSLPSREPPRTTAAATGLGLGETATALTPFEGDDDAGTGVEP